MRLTNETFGEALADYFNGITNEYDDALTSVALTADKAAEYNQVIDSSGPYSEGDMVPDEDTMVVDFLHEVHKDKLYIKLNNGQVFVIHYEETVAPSQLR